MNPDVIVVGGGLHGTSAALHIARRGKRVLVLEKDRVAAHASSYSAGGVRTLGRDLAEVPLAVESLALWHRIKDLVGDDCGFQVTGHVKVAESEAEMATLRERAETMRKAGWSHEELIDRDELRRVLPAVSEHAVGGLIARDNGFARPYQTTMALCRAAEAAGAVIREGAGVVGVERRGEQWSVRCSDGRYACGAGSGEHVGRVGRTLGAGGGRRDSARVFRADDDLHLGCATIRNAGRGPDRATDVVQAGADRPCDDWRRASGNRRSRYRINPA